MLPDLGDRTDFVDFVNEGLGIWSQHPWQYLSGRRYFVTLGDDGTVELDERVREVVAVWPEGDHYRRIRILPRFEFERVGRTLPFRAHCTIEDRPSQKVGIRGEPTPWLVLHEDHPFESDFVVLADIGLKRVQAPTDRIDIPHRFEPAAVALLRAFARGRFDMDAGGVEKELDDFMKGRVWLGATRMDGAMVNALDDTLGPAGKIMASRGIEFDEDVLPVRYRGQ